MSTAERLRAVAAVSDAEMAATLSLLVQEVNALERTVGELERALDQLVGDECEDEQRRYAAARRANAIAASANVHQIRRRL